jgi:hypothetical protein
VSNVSVGTLADPNYTFTPGSVGARHDVVRSSTFNN